MAVVALAGALIGWITYEFLYWINPLDLYRATTTWIVEFAIGVVRQHAMHRWFTFRQPVPYWSTLSRAYVFYLVSALLSAGANFFLTEQLHLHYRIAWVICTLIVACMSLLFLKTKVFMLTGDRRTAYKADSSLSKQIVNEATNER